MSIASTHQRWGFSHKKVGRGVIYRLEAHVWGYKVQKRGLQQSNELSCLGLKYCYGQTTNMNTTQTIK